MNRDLVPCELLRLEFLSFSFVKQSFTSNTTVLVCYLHPFIYIYIYTHMHALTQRFYTEVKKILQ